MTTKFMRIHAKSLPLKKRKPKKRLKPVIKRTIYPGSITYPKQAKVLQDALGWMDTVQFQNLAVEVVRKMHEMGFRIAKISSKVAVRALFEKGST